jgi:hypothetical protein
MKLITIVLLIGVLNLSVMAQTEDDIVNIAARISQTENVSKVLGYKVEGDTLLHFDYMLPEMVGANFPFYEYDEFTLNVGMSSSNIVNGTPYGKIYVKDFGKKGAKIILLLNGVGNRLKEGEWNYAIYEFKKPKNGKWMLKDVDFVTKEIDDKLLK